MKTLFILFFVVYGTKCQQLVFPNDNFNTKTKTSTNPVFTDNRYYGDNSSGSIARGVNNLGINLNSAIIRGLQNNYGAISRTQKDENIVLSPVSIANCLALVLLGANGRTYNELITAMGLNLTEDIDVLHQNLGSLIRGLESAPYDDEIVRVAAAIFVQNDYNIRGLYKQASQFVYGSEIVDVDFRGRPKQAETIVNSWVAGKTNQKIKRILPQEPDTKTEVIMASALYFNGPWEYPFFEEHTKLRPFYVNGRNSPTDVKVEMMIHGGNFKYFKDHALGCEILGLPYKGRKTAMYVIVPTNSNAKVLKEFSNKINADNLERLVASAREDQVSVLFPKMKLEGFADLKGPLGDVGVNDLFLPSANLALLSPGRGGSSVREILGAVQNAPRINLSQPQNLQQNYPLNSIPSSSMIFNNTQSASSQTFSRGKIPNYNATESLKDRLLFSRFGAADHSRRKRETADSLNKLRNILNRNSNDRNAENPGLYVDNVYHKVFIEVTEKGTEAAAATATSLNRGGVDVFRADVPFIFFIRNEATGMILFWGTVFEPKPSY